MNRFFLTTILALVLGTGYAVAAPGLPEYYPEDFAQVGNLVGVNTQDNFIVVDDVSTLLASDLKVHTPATQFGTLRSLHPGMKVGITLREGASRRTVSDVWVLPAGYKPE